MTAKCFCYAFGPFLFTLFSQASSHKRFEIHGAPHLNAGEQLRMDGALTGGAGTEHELGRKVMASGWREGLELSSRFRRYE